MKIYGIEKMSLVDYDGKVSATLFTGKCNFRCGFCHNSPLVIDVDNLQTLDEQEVLSYLKKRKGILDGVCITGGEPTLESGLPSFIEKIKALGYPVKLDTNGTNPDLVKSLFNDNLIDYVAMDIKNDKDNYAKIIGLKTFNTASVEKTVNFLLSNDFDYEFRTTLIDEYHKKENIENICKWINGAKKYAMQKFKPGDNCIAQGLTQVDDDTAKEFLRLAQNYIPSSFLRGYDL